MAQSSNPALGRGIWAGSAARELEHGARSLGRRPGRHVQPPGVRAAGALHDARRRGAAHRRHARRGRPHRRRRLDRQPAGPGDHRRAGRLRAGAGHRVQAEHQPGADPDLRGGRGPVPRRDQPDVQRRLRRRDRHPGGGRHGRCVRRDARRLQDRRDPGDAEVHPLAARRADRRRGAVAGQPDRLAVHARRARPAATRPTRRWRSASACCASASPRSRSCSTST